MSKKRIVIALGHDALGTTVLEQWNATKRTAVAVAEFVSPFDKLVNGNPAFFISI